jgi:hypothetical protein
MDVLYLRARTGCWSMPVVLLMHDQPDRGGDYYLEKKYTERESMIDEERLVTCPRLPAT